MAQEARGPGDGDSHGNGNLVIVGQYPNPIVGAFAMLDQSGRYFPRCAAAGTKGHRRNGHSEQGDGHDGHPGRDSYPPQHPHVP